MIKKALFIAGIVISLLGRIYAGNLLPSPSITLGTFEEEAVQVLTALKDSAKELSGHVPNKRVEPHLYEKKRNPRVPYKRREVVQVKPSKSAMKKYHSLIQNIFDAEQKRLNEGGKPRHLNKDLQELIPVGSNNSACFFYYLMSEDFTLPTYQGEIYTKTLEIDKMDVKHSLNDNATFIKEQWEDNNPGINPRRIVKDIAAVIGESQRGNVGYYIATRIM